MSVCRLFRDERGVTTTSMVLSLLITLALIFTAAQVYRVNSASAEVQDVADAAALSAEGQVAEFMIVARFCDAVVLSLSFTGLVTCGVGIACLCIPPAAELSVKLLDAGKTLLQQRNEFSRRSAQALNKMQEALPFFAAACAAGVSAANNADSSGANYLGVALLVPSKGEEIEALDSTKSDELVNEIDEKSDDVREKAKKAEEASEAASAAKEKAYMRDCGDTTRSMYERAESLVGLTGSNNPRYASVDAWSFQVALNRAKQYYYYRSYRDQPSDSSVEAQAKSQLMKRYCSYAYQLLCREGYVHETSDSFDACFPIPPKNTDETKLTRLYTESVYPVTEEKTETTRSGGDGEDAAKEVKVKRTVHAWSGCPGITEGIVGYESLSGMESQELEVCPYCRFTITSMSNIASANSSINSGFEYHYRAVAQAAEEYKKARDEADQQKKEAKEGASGLYGKLLEAFKEAADCRIEVTPPGCYGSLAFVVNMGVTSAAGGFASGFVASNASLGPRAAISAATLVDEGSDEGRNVLNSMLDGLQENGGVAVGALGIVLDVWSSALKAYANGVDAVTGGIERGLNAIPLATASGLGTWAADKLRSLLSDFGFQPAELGALKPVIVNSAHVAAKDDGSLGSGLMSVKSKIIAHPLYSTDLFTALLTDAEKTAVDGVKDLGNSIDIASIELFGAGGPSIPITIPLPDAAKQYGIGAIQGLFATLREIHAQTVEVRAWE